jgi:hypothetical protein
MGFPEPVDPATLTIPQLQIRACHILEAEECDAPDVAIEVGQWRCWLCRRVFDISPEDPERSIAEYRRRFGKWYGQGQIERLCHYCYEMVAKVTGIPL